MHYKTIKTNSFELCISDSSRAVDQKLHRALAKKVEVALEVYSTFLLRKNGLNLGQKKVKRFTMSLGLCGNRRIRSLNRDYRNKDKITDVLSFPIFESLRPESCEPIFFSELELGDIYISLPVSARQSVEYSVSHVDEILHELTHGFLHLCGYDHELSEQEETVMIELEEKLLNQIRKKLRN